MGFSDLTVAIGPGGTLDYKKILTDVNGRVQATFGNVNGPADFGLGATTAQTLRVTANIARNGNELSYGSGNTDANTLRVASNMQITGADVSGSNSVYTRASQGTLTDRSGTATTTSAQFMAANSARKYLFIQNTSAGIIWFDFTAAAVAASPSIELGPGESFEMSGHFISTEAINIRSQTLTRSFTAKEG